MLEEPLLNGLERDERFLEGILRTSEGDPELSILDLETSPGIGKGENFMSSVTRVNIRARNKHRESVRKAVLIKRQPANLTRRETFRCDPAFRNEASAYKVVLPAFREFTGESLPFPACFHASSQLLVLEDLAPLGYKMADRQQGLDLKHSKLALKYLGRYHGVSLAMKRSNPEGFEKIKSEIKELIFVPEGMATFSVSMEGSLSRVLTVLKAEEPGPLDEAIHNLQGLRGTVFQRMTALVTPKEPLSVICHGDYWVNNLLFKYNEKEDPEDLMIVDLQVTRYACPATDVLQLLYTSTEPGLTEECFDELLEAYHVGLVEEAGPAAPSLAQVAEQVEERALYGFLIAALLLPVVTADKEDGLVDLDDLDQATLASTEFSDRLQDNVSPGYRNRVRRIAMEFVERGFL